MNQENKPKCIKCGSEAIKFQREICSSSTKSKTRKKHIGSGKKGTSISQNEYITVGVCQSCGHTYEIKETPLTMEKPHNEPKNLWLWILGWIFCFPIPLTVILFKKQSLNPIIKYSFIAGIWLLFLLLCICGVKTEDSAPVYNQPESTQNELFLQEENEIITISPTKTSDYSQEITLNSNTEFEDTRIMYNIPAGEYTVTTSDNYRPYCIYIYSKKTCINENGWEEFETSTSTGLVDGYKSCEITINDNEWIYLGKIDRTYNFVLKNNDMSKND